MAASRLYFRETTQPSSGQPLVLLDQHQVYIQASPAPQDRRISPPPWSAVSVPRSAVPAGWWCKGRAGYLWNGSGTQARRSFYPTTWPQASGISWPFFPHLGQGVPHRVQHTKLPLRGGEDLPHGGLPSFLFPFLGKATMPLDQTHFLGHYPCGWAFSGLPVMQNEDWDF